MRERRKKKEERRTKEEERRKKKEERRRKKKEEDKTGVYIAKISRFTGTLTYAQWLFLVSRSQTVFGGENGLDN